MKLEWKRLGRLAERYYGSTRDIARAIYMHYTVYNTICVKATIFDHIYDNFRPHIRQFSTKIFVHLSKPDYLFLPDLFAFGKSGREKNITNR